MLGGWAVLGMGSGAMGGLAACAWMLALAGVLRFWRGQPRGAVRWDGQSWAFQHTPQLPQIGARPGASMPNRFYMYGVVARVAMLAASYELEATNPNAEIYD